MIYNIVNKPAVIDDINEIISSFNKEFAIIFLEKIENAKKYIVSFPYAFQIKYKNVRTV